MEPNTNTPTGQEIEQAKNVFQRLADAIVQMTSLHEQVQRLQSDFSQMKDEMDRLRRTNDALEESLSHARHQRIELEETNNRLQTELNETKSRLSQSSDEHKREQDRADRVTQERDEARKERDDAQLRVMELEDKLKAAEEKLNTLQESFRKIFGQIEQPKATPEPIYHTQPEPIHPAVSDPEPVPATPISHSWKQQPAQEQPAKRRIYEGEEGFSWSDAPEGQPRFDEATRRWYVEV